LDDLPVAENARLTLYVGLNFRGKPARVE